MHRVWIAFCKIVTIMLLVLARAASLLPSKFELAMSLEGTYEHLKSPINQQYEMKNYCENTYTEHQLWKY